MNLLASSACPQTLYKRLVFAAPMPSIASRNAAWICKRSWRYITLGMRSLASSSLSKQHTQTNVHQFAESRICERVAKAVVVTIFSPGPSVLMHILVSSSEFQFSSVLLSLVSQAEVGYGEHLVKLCVTSSLVNTVLLDAQTRAT